MRRLTTAIRREMRRRATVEPVIGHLKIEQRMDRNYLQGAAGELRRPGGMTALRPSNELWVLFAEHPALVCLPRPGATQRQIVC